MAFGEKKIIEIQLEELQKGLKIEKEDFINW